MVTRPDRAYLEASQRDSIRAGNELTEALTPLFGGDRKRAEQAVDNYVREQTHRIAEENPEFLAGCGATVEELASREKTIAFVERHFFAKAYGPR